MTEITELRDEIDLINREILDLLIKRNGISEKIALCKKENGLPVFDERREEEIIVKSRAYAGEENAECAEAVFRTIMEYSRKRQEKVIGSADR